jgi:hypothetical protein
MRPTCSPVPRVPAVRSRRARCLLSRWPQPHTGSCAPSYRRAYSHFCPHVHYCTSARCILPFLLHDFRSSSTPHCAPELSQYTEGLRLARSVWQCSKGEAKSAIGLALAQRHPSSPGSRSSLGSVGWLPQWTPFVLAYIMPSPPQPPPSVQRSFSLSPNDPPWQPSPSLLRNDHRPRRARQAHCPQWLPVPPQGPS